jgi:hypothetical protein
MVAGFVALAGAGAAAVFFFVLGGEASSARSDVAAIGEEIEAQYAVGEEPFVIYDSGAYSIGATILGASIEDPTVEFYSGADDFCVVLTTSSGSQYSYSAVEGAVDGSCAPDGVSPFDPGSVGALDTTLTSSDYWFDLSIGDCLLDDTSIVSTAGQTDPLTAPTVVACSEPHMGEVYAIAGIGGENAPDEAAFRLHTHELCEGAPFESYIGMPYLDSDLYYSVLYPTGETFEAGANEMVCILTTGDETTGSLRDSAAAEE